MTQLVEYYIIKEPKNYPKIKFEIIGIKFQKN